MIAAGMKWPKLWACCRWVMVVLWGVLAGCASGKTGMPAGGIAEYETLRYRPTTPQDAPDSAARKRAKQHAAAVQHSRARGGGPRALVAQAVLAGSDSEDAFETVLGLAGLKDTGLLPPPEEPLTPEDAAALYEALLATPGSLAQFGPRRVASYLLTEAMEGEEELPRAVLLQRVARFRTLAVLRPDGYLAWALTGNTQQRVAPVEWKNGAFRALAFEVGPFYSGRNGAFFAVDAQLREDRSSGVLAEVYDDADYINRSLDGAQSTCVALALSVGKLVGHPVRSAEELTELPGAVLALVKNSPQYLERFKLMTRGEQIRSVAELATTLLLARGTAGAGTRTMAAVGQELEAVSVTALSLTAEGTVALERVAVPVGRAVTALSGGPGAAIILQQVNDAARQGAPRPVQGPGQWAPSKESMSKRSARYQEQITGRPASEAYWVGGKDFKSGGVKLDGFEDGVLLDAKGPGYSNKFTDNLKPKPWFKESGARQLIEQARRQLKVAPGTPIRWHVAEKKAADAIRKLLSDEDVPGIEVVHTPALP